MAFEKKFIVEREHIDQMGHVNNVVYLQYVQEVAEAHWLSCADELIRKEALWVVLRHEIDYKSQAFEGDQLLATTWVEEADGVKMPRIVIIKNVDGKEVIKAKTIWCCLDGQSLRPKRITSELYDLFF